jgi:hypothetical protein
MAGHTVSLYRLQSEGASSGRANRIVVAEEHLDCYLHGCPCGYQGDTRCACSCAPGATGRYQQRQSTGHRSPFAIHLESLRPTTQASEQGVGLFPARWLVTGPSSRRRRGWSILARGGTAVGHFRRGPGWSRATIAGPVAFQAVSSTGSQARMRPEKSSGTRGSVPQPLISAPSLSPSPSVSAMLGFVP